MSEEQLDDYERKLLANVEEYGCQVTHVFDPEGKGLGFCYSIGFMESLGQPEVIVFGLRAELMQFMINELKSRCDDGFKLAEGERVAGLIEGFECELREVHKSNIIADYFGSAMWYAKHRGEGRVSKAFQLVWPGAVHGKFPWECDRDDPVVTNQELLYEPKGPSIDPPA